MKAYVLHGINDIRFEEVAKPDLRDWQCRPAEVSAPSGSESRSAYVLVKVETAGICGSDIPRIYHNGAHRMPLIPGHEFAGTVVECGENAARKWLNKRVGVFPLIPCMECPQCMKKQYEMCRNYNYLGSRTDGGFAEYVAVPEWNLLELPDSVSFEQAAMLEPASVAMHAIRIIRVQKGEKVAVCGLGTIGLLLAMHLKGMGIESVYVLGNKELQQEMAARIGISKEYYCDTRVENAAGWLMSKTDGEGVDVFFECVGRNEVVTLALESAAAGGRVMLVGNPASDMLLQRDVYWQILRKQLTVMGTWNSSYRHAEEDDWHVVLQAIRQGKIHPDKLISHRFSLEELGRGMEIMRDKSEEYVKVMGIL